MRAPAQIKTGLPVLPGNPAVFLGDPWFSDPAFLRVWLFLRRSDSGCATRLQMYRPNLSRSSLRPHSWESPRFHQNAAD